MSQSLESQYNELPQDQQAAVQASLVVEVKVHNLRAGTPLPEHQLDRTLADHRKKAHDMLSPAARLVVEGTLRRHGILKLGHIPAPPGVLDWSKLEGGTAA